MPVIFRYQDTECEAGVFRSRTYLGDTSFFWPTRIAYRRSLVAALYRDNGWRAINYLGKFRVSKGTMSTSAGLSAMSTKVPDIMVEAASTQSEEEHLPMVQGASESERVKRGIIRKVDWRMLPLLGLLSALSLIDRSNLGLARTAGMDHALRLSVGYRYSIVSFIFFVPYILFQLPSNLFLRKLGAVHYLAFLVISWGSVQLAMGFVPTWQYLAMFRALLGTFEAGFFPAMVFIITTWYTRHEVQIRLAAFYVIGVFTGGFSAIFAYAITLLQGRYGIPGWAWIFIIEGAITIVFGVIAWFYLPNFPDKNGFLNEEETAYILERVEKDRGDSVPDVLSKEKVIAHLMDWKIWAIGVMYMCATMPAYAISLFLTIILRGMGWSISASLLLSAPPYVFAATTIMVFAWISDKYHQRAAIIAIQTVVTIVGLLLTGFATGPGWRYVGIFLGNAGSGGCIPGIIAYSSNNIVTQTKRAVSTALVVSFGGIGGILASFAFQQKDFPHYIPGIYATLACQLLLLTILSITTISYWRSNRALRDGTCTEPLEGQIGFFYTL